MFGFDEHSFFIISAYIAAIILLGGLGLYVDYKHRIISKAYINYKKTKHE